MQTRSKILTLFVLLLVALLLPACASLSSLDKAALCDLAFRSCNLFAQMEAHLQEQPACAHYQPNELTIMRHIQEDYARMRKLQPDSTASQNY